MAEGGSLLQDRASAKERPVSVLNLDAALHVPTLQAHGGLIQLGALSREAWMLWGRGVERTHPRGCAVPDPKEVG